jgi:hypothetical protein
MGGLVTGSWQPTGQWWIYKRYADQTGLQAAVTAGSQADAVAYLDSAARKAIIVVGNKGSVTGTVSVKINNIPADLQAAGPAQLLIENMPNGTTAVSAPIVVSNSAMTVTENSLTVPLSWTKAADGYAISLTFGDQDAGVSGKDSGPNIAVDARGIDTSAGGTSGAGGSTGSGGASGSGGSNRTGGTPGFGGALSTGGSKGTGGFAVGGTSGIGGAPRVGGMTGSGGAQGTGGTTGGATTTSAGSSGCSCSIGRHRDHLSIATWLLVLFGMAAIGRGRQRRS